MGLVKSCFVGFVWSAKMEGKFSPETNLYSVNFQNSEPGGERKTEVPLGL